MNKSSRNMSGGKEAKVAESQRKAATSSARGTKQPKGSINPQHAKATKKAKKEKNPSSYPDSMEEMRF